MSDTATLNEVIHTRHIAAEVLTFTESCHSVADAAKAVHADITDFVKNICFVNEKGNCIVAIAKGEDKVDLEKVKTVTKSTSLTIATPTQVLAKTTYPVGGVPSFGFTATFLIDEKVMQKTIIYSGGGSSTALVKITPTELRKANRGLICSIVQ